MKKRTKEDIYRDYADAINNIRQGKSPRRSQRKDGSISTKPVVEVEQKPEAEVLADCVKFCKRNGIVVDRHDVGAGDFGHGYATYGIVGAGDLIGFFSNGKHLEIECKKGKGGRLSKAQQKRMKKLVRNNCYYFIVHGVEELEYFINEVEL